MRVPTMIANLVGTQMTMIMAVMFMIMIMVINAMFRPSDGTTPQHPQANCHYAKIAANFERISHFPGFQTCTTQHYQEYGNGSYGSHPLQY